VVDAGAKAENAVRIIPTAKNKIANLFMVMGVCIATTIQTVCQSKIFHSRQLTNRPPIPKGKDGRLANNK
jgi:hypothetical protein